MLGSSDNYYGVVAQNASSTTPQLKVQARGGNGASSQPMIVATNGNGLDVMSLDQAGNIVIAGTLTVNGSPLTTTKTTTGASLRTSSSRQPQPATEDLGEGRLANGAAYVRLDPAFASTIDRSSAYLVFITPLGNSHALFVANRSAMGFEVRESEFGHGSVGFDYRMLPNPTLRVQATYRCSATSIRAVPIRPKSTGRSTFSLRRTKFVKFPKPCRGCHYLNASGPHYFGYVISLGTTNLSKSSAFTCPNETAASLSVDLSRCAFLAISADLS